MGPYREYVVKVLVPTHGRDVAEAIREAVHDAVAEEHEVLLVRVGSPRDRSFSELTAYEANEITRRELAALDDDEGGAPTDGE